MKELFFGLFAIVFGLMVVLWWPIAIIWSVNALFRTEIPYTIQTWLAVVLLVSFCRVAYSSEKR